jgi:hypothetical protein
VKNVPEKTHEELEKEVKEIYRRVFSSTEGMMVLSHMLANLGIFNEVAPDDPEEIARQNYARELLRTLGMLSSDAEDIRQLITNWFKIGRKEINSNK